MVKQRLVYGLVLACALTGCQIKATGTVTPGGASASPSTTASPAAATSPAPKASASPTMSPSPKASKAPIAASGAPAFTSTTADAKTAQWVLYKSDDFGFQMAVPEGTAIADKDFGGGWGGLYAAYGDAEIFGVSKLGAEASYDDIEAFAVNVSEIPADKWTQGPSGSNANGWKDWRTAHVTDGKDTVIAIYGHGPKGNYLLFLKTSNEDLTRNTASYEKWGDNVVLL